MHCGAPRGPEPVRVQLCRVFTLFQLSVPRRGKHVKYAWQQDNCHYLQHQSAKIHVPPVRCVEGRRYAVTCQQQCYSTRTLRPFTLFSFILTPAAPRPPPPPPPPRGGGARPAAAAPPPAPPGAYREREGSVDLGHHTRCATRSAHSVRTGYAHTHQHNNTPRHDTQTTVINLTLPSQGVQVVTRVVIDGVLPAGVFTQAALAW